MMLSPESYYEMNLKSKTEKELRSAICGLLRMSILGVPKCIWNDLNKLYLRDLYFVEYKIEALIKIL